MTDLNGLPWWTKTLWVAGPITLIALGLVWLLATRIDSNMKNIDININSIKENFSLHHQESESLNRNIEEYMRIQNLLTRQLCVNAASTSDERAGCFKN